MNNQPDLLVQIERHIARLTINRPDKRNALSPQAIDLMVRALDAAEADPDVHVIVVTGAGDQAFCAGADLLGALGDGVSGFDLYSRLLKRLAQFEKPTLARVNGYCLAGGIGVLLACDLAVAGSDVEFGTPEVNVGLFPMMISTLMLRDLQRKHALELMLLGERIDAQQALAWGMVNRVVPPAELDQTVDRLADSLAARSALGLKLGKQALNAVQGLSFDAAVDELSDRLQAMLKTEDAQEGLRAFREKRPPNFQGR